VPPSLITPPAIVAGRRGLLAVATTPGDVPADWLHGVAFTPEPCAAPEPLPWVVCDTDVDLPTDPETRPAASLWQPIWLRGEDVCSTLDGFRFDERERRARANLTATASWQAESEFSDAVASSQAGDENPHLTDPTGWVTVASATAGTPEPAAFALALLEQDLAECLHGQRGMLHAPPAVVALWDAAGQLHMEGQVLVTANDNVVVAGSGYSGNEPDGSAPDAGSLWAYGTALVYQVRGEATTEGEASERVDRAQNTVVTWVTQPLLVFTSPCCKIGAEVSIDGSP
jgi:hypothetical protein